MSLEVLNRIRTERSNIVEVNPNSNFNVFYKRNNMGVQQGIAISPPRGNIYPQSVVAPQMRSSIPLRAGSSIPSSSYQGKPQTVVNRQADINVDPDRLHDESIKSGKGKSYTVTELRTIAGQLGLSTAGIKKELIDVIRGSIM